MRYGWARADFARGKTMLQIRTAQWQALQAGGLRQFEHEMVRHLSGFAPELAQVMGKERMHELVRIGLARGQAYGYTNRGPLRSYLETMLALGSHFDTDPVLARATSVLRSEGVPQLASAAALHEGIAEYFKQVNGPRNEYALAAMTRTRDVPYEALPGGGDVRARAFVLFRGGFPQKYHYAKEDALQSLWTSSELRSAEFGLKSEAGRLLVVSLMYGYGHGVFSDPAYRWTADTMRDPALPDPEQRAQHLYRKNRLYLTAALKNLAP